MILSTTNTIEGYRDYLADMPNGAFRDEAEARIARLDQERQNDILQETLINVVGAYAVQSYVGSYGPMSHPVAACATAAVSAEEAFDKILTRVVIFGIVLFELVSRQGIPCFDFDKSD